MKRFLCVLLCALLLVPAAAYAEEPTGGTLKMVAYNVSGIPLVGDFQGTTVTTTNDRAKRIGALLNTLDVDYISTEEDFNAADTLAAQMTNYPGRTYTSGGLFQGQGLNAYSVHKIYNVERVNWDFEYGTLSGSADLLANKGFLYTLMELDEGVYVNVITVHMDAGVDAISALARANNFKQLAKYVNEKLNDGRALIIQGDFNFRFWRDLPDDMYKNLLEPTGLKDVWCELYGGGIHDPHDPAFKQHDSGDVLDRVLYRSGDYVTLEPLERSVPDLTENGNRYTDHNPMYSEFKYTVNALEPTPETLVEPTPENKAVQTLKEVLWFFVRLLQAVFGVIEIPYLIGQGFQILYEKVTA